jgi:hypothetical protein
MPEDTRAKAGVMAEGQKKKRQRQAGQLIKPKRSFTEPWIYDTHLLIEPVIDMIQK